LGQVHAASLPSPVAIIPPRTAQHTRTPTSTALCLSSCRISNTSLCWSQQRLPCRHPGSPSSPLDTLAGARRRQDQKQYL